MQCCAGQVGSHHGIYLGRRCAAKVGKTLASILNSTLTNGVQVTCEDARA